MRTLPLHVLYILVRTDMASMNSGKAIAQGSHASNAFVHLVNELAEHKHAQAATDWQKQTFQGFGTVLTLGVNEKQMRDVDEVFQELGYIANIVNDNSYPLVDGDVVHFLNIDTCSFVFVPDKEDNDVARMILSRFGLHP